MDTLWRSFRGAMTDGLDSLLRRRSRRIMTSYYKILSVSCFGNRTWLGLDVQVAPLANAGQFDLDRCIPIWTTVLTGSGHSHPLGCLHSSNQVSCSSVLFVKIILHSNQSHLPSPAGVFPLPAQNCSSRPSPNPGGNYSPTYAERRGVCIRDHAHARCTGSQPENISYFGLWSCGTYIFLRIYKKRAKYMSHKPPAPPLCVPWATKPTPRLPVWRAKGSGPRASPRLTGTRGWSRGGLRSPHCSVLLVDWRIRRRPS